MKTWTRREWAAALATAAAQARAPEPEQGFVPLFDGRTLNGWILVHGKG